MTEKEKVTSILTPSVFQTWWDMVTKGQSQPDSAWNYQNFYTGQTTGARVFFETTSDSLWICLPGSRSQGIVANNEMKDMFSFFLAKTKIDDKTSVYLHSGFVKCALELFPTIQDYLKTNLNASIKNIYIEGYSMGADVGAILWLLLKNQIKLLNINLCLLMIGGSRILGWGQRNKLDGLDNVLSFRNDQDWATHIPPKISPLGLYAPFTPYIQVGNPWNVLSDFRGIFDFSKNAHYYDNYFAHIKEKFLS